MEVVRIQPTLPDSAQRLQSLCPDVIIFDGSDNHLGNLPRTTQFSRENPGALIIGLDAENDSITILSSEQRQITRSEDIIEAIGKASNDLKRM